MRKNSFMKVLILFFCFVSGVAGQESLPTSQQSPESRVAQTIKTLESDNALRRSLEGGERGNGVHRAWMDKMQRFRIKQAAFTIAFTWLNGVESLKITDVRFLKQYYRYDTQIKDQGLLREMQVDGLERDLCEAILLRAVEFVPTIMQNIVQIANVKSKQARGTLYLNLLDDEVLPILDEMPDVEW